MNWVQGADCAPSTCAGKRIWSGTIDDDLEDTPLALALLENRQVLRAVQALATHPLCRAPSCSSSPPLEESPHWPAALVRSEEHTSELQSRPHLVCRPLLETKNRIQGLQP